MAMVELELNWPFFSVSHFSEGDDDTKYLWWLPINAGGWVGGGTTYIRLDSMETYIERLRSSRSYMCNWSTAAEEWGE